MTTIIDFELLGTNSESTTNLRLENGVPLHTAVVSLILLAAAVFATTATVAHSQDLKPARIGQAEINNLRWATSPTGSSQAVVVGDPTKPGIYVVRSKFPPGLRTPVHFHPDDRIVTVLSGTAYVGFGNTFDESKLKALPAGSVWTEPARQPHYNWAKDGELVLQIVGHGPSGMTRVTPDH